MNAHYPVLEAYYCGAVRFRPRSVSASEGEVACPDALRRFKRQDEQQLPTSPSPNGMFFGDIAQVCFNVQPSRYGRLISLYYFSSMRTANVAPVWDRDDVGTPANCTRRETSSTRAPLIKCTDHLTAVCLLMPPTNMARTSRTRSHLLRTMTLVDMSATMGNGCCLPVPHPWITT